MIDKTDRAAARPSTPLNAAEAIGLVAATALSVGVAAIALGGRQFWVDESFSYHASRLSLGDAWRFAVDEGGELNMVLYYQLLRPISSVTAASALLRMPSVVAAIGALAVVWLITSRMTEGRFARCTAVLLLVAQPLFLDYAFEARSYAVLMFVVAGLSLLLMQALDGSRRSGLAYAILAPLSIGLHFVALLVIAAHALAVLVATRGGGRDRVIAMLRLVGPAIVVGLLAAKFFYPQRTLDDRASIGLRDVAASAYTLTGRAGPLSLLMAVALGAGALHLWRERERHAGGVVLLVMLFVPGVLALVLSLNRPMLWARYLLYVVPIIACVAAIGIGSLLHNRALRIATVAVFVGLGLIGQAVIYATPDRDTPDDAASFVLDQAGDGDVILFYPAVAQLAYQHYLDVQGGTGPRQIGQIPDPNFPSSSVTIEAAATGLGALPPGAAAWIIGGGNTSAPSPALEAELEDAGLQQVDRLDRMDSGDVWAERWESPTG